MAFKCNDKEYNYTTVPLSDLLFSERVADMVEECKGTFPDSLFGNIFDDGLFKLNKKRLDSVMNGYNTGELPPISVMQTLGGKYKVLNGRHRVCATILMDGDTIPVKIQI